MTIAARLTIDDPTYFDRLAEIDQAHWWSRGMWQLAAHWLDGLLRGRRGLKALDVGCGTGATLMRLARRAEVAEVVGIDPSPEALAWSKARHGHRLVRGDALALPVAGMRFDLVTCFDVVQHLPKHREADAAAELRRVLRPGGLAIIRANGRGWARVADGELRPYRLHDLSAAIESGGLRVCRATYANSLPALAHELCGRLRIGPGTSANGHPEGGGLQIRVPSFWKNGMMSAISATEAVAAGRVGLRLPFGHSTLILAERLS
jgi:SAM-dependent methyltransferase